jgi:branched-chain amino acid transport system substrate-binding protein
LYENKYFGDKPIGARRSGVELIVEDTGGRGPGGVRVTRWAQWSIAAGSILGLTAGCGSRLSTEEVLAGNGRPEAVAAATTARSGGPAVATASKDAEGTLAGGTPLTAAPEDAATGSGATAAGALSSSSSAGVGDTTKAPIVVGFVGYLSGIGSTIGVPARDAWVAWQRLVNARGGINGHPVQLLIGDDGGNESRGIAMARDFVENKGAIALTWMSAEITGLGNYARSKGVAVVGNGVFDEDWNRNPMLFPVTPNTLGASWAEVRQAKDVGATKVATIYCVEAAACKVYRDLFHAEAAAQGLQVVHDSAMSLTQPDFTAECLRMRNAGAELVIPWADNNSAARMAQSCARQGYRPIWEMTSVDDSMASVPEFDGAIAPLLAFPWFVRSGSPGVDEYVQAFQQFAPARLREGSNTQTYGWVSAKVFEQAARHATRASGRPTRTHILDGLWAIKVDTIGGIYPGPMARTFTRGRPTPETYCYFDARIRGGRWVAPNGIRPTCR